MTKEDWIGTFLMLTLCGLVAFAVWRFSTNKSTEEHSVYHIYDKIEITRDVHEAYPVVIITTNVWRLKGSHRELIMYRQEECAPHKVDSIKFEHSKQINEKINKVLNETI